jgi:hypothetical protein
MTEVYTWLTDQLTALATTIDNNLEWFFKNGKSSFSGSYIESLEKQRCLFS